MLDGALKSLRQRLALHELGDVLHLGEGEVALVGDVLHLLSVSFIVTQLLNDESRAGGLDADFCVSVLALELDHDSDSLPLGTFLDDIFSDFLSILH